jgi:hypothetical protein
MLISDWIPAIVSAAGAAWAVYKYFTREVERLRTDLLWVHFDAKLARAMLDGVIAGLTRDKAISRERLMEIWADAWFKLGGANGGSDLATDKVRSTLQNWERIGPDEVIAAYLKVPPTINWDIKR